VKKSLFDQIESIVANAMIAAGLAIDFKPKLTYSTKKEFGDYQANGILPAAKQLKINPRDLASKVIEKLDKPEFISKIEIAGPGFINFFISKKWLSKSLSSLKSDVDSLIPKCTNRKVIVIDYSGPNLAKEMHVGHLRSTIIGDCLSRVCSRLGYSVIRQNHVGDWGTQFGMLLTHMSDMKNQGTAIKTELADLEVFYKNAKKHFDSDPDFAQRAREEVVKLQSGDPTRLKYWSEFINISLEHCFDVYKRLGVLLSKNDLKPESSYNSVLKGIVEDVRAKGLLSESEGAQCVFLENFKGRDDEPLPIILQKSDGGFLYATTDLAALQYRSYDLNASRILYVVDIRQALHFEQIFALAKKASFVKKNCVLEHIPFGTMLGKDGKPFKTRSGDTVKLNDLLDESVERALKVVTEKNPNLDKIKRSDIAYVVGINAVKYADLSKNRKSNYVFDWDTMLSFEGNTAPYLMYAYARIQSIVRDAGEVKVNDITINESEEKDLALKIHQFREILNKVEQDCMPNYICQYVYELAVNFMSFYEKCPVLKAEPEIRDSRLALCIIAGHTIHLGFDLLGLKILNRM